MSNPLVAGQTSIQVFGEDKIIGGPYPIPLDISGRFVPTIEIEHSRIHESAAFTYSLKAIVLKNTNLDFLIVVNTGKHPHFRDYTFSSTSVPCDIFLYENTVTLNNGILQEILNNNRNSSNTCDINLYLKPIITDIGKQIHYDIISEYKSIGGNVKTIPVEWILQPIEKYLLRLTNNSLKIAIVAVNLFFVNID